MLINVDIFGSCVTRDLFEFDKQRCFKINEYIARQAVISSLSKPLYYSKENIHLSSNFQKKQIESDLNKDIFLKLQNSLGEYLIIDMIEERFKIAKIDRSYITVSNELNLSRFLDNYSFKLYDKDYRHGKVYFRHKAYKKIISAFCKKILEIYNEDKIIIHEVYLSNRYINKNGVINDFPENCLNDLYIFNQKLVYIYQILKEILPNAFILYLGNQYIASENNKWGLAPMHFQEQYYIEALQKLYNYIYK